MIGVCGRRPGLLLAAAAALPYLNALPNGFAFDDHGLVVANRAVAEFDVAAMVFGDYWSGYRDSRSGLYRPLTLLTFAVERAAFGTRPLPFHVTNLSLHVGVTLLAWRLLARSVDPRTAAWAAAVFAVLPGHSEAVVAITGRADLLAAAATLACLWVWLVPRPAPGRLAAGAGLFALGLLAKETAAVAPALLACVHWYWRRGRRLPCWPWPPYAIAAGVLAAYLGVRFAVLGGFGVGPVEPLDNPLVTLQGLPRALAALSVASRYAGLLVLPARLSADYGHAAIPVAPLPATAAAIGVALLVLLVGLLVRFARRPDPFGLAAAWTAVAFAPVSNLVVPIGTIMAERLTYAPSVGFALGLGWSLATARRRLDGRTAAALTAGLLLAWGGRTAARCADWRDDLTLFAAAVRAVPASARAHEGLGSALKARGQLAAAEGEYRRALDLYGRYDTAHYNLGLVLYDTARYGQALAHFERACALRPSHAEAHLNRGAALFRLGRYDEAEAAYRRALQLRPGWGEAARNLEDAASARTGRGGAGAPDEGAATDRPGPRPSGDDGKGGT